MIRAMPGVLAAHPDTYYLVVGGGAHHDALLEEATKANVDGRVIFTGMRSDVQSLLVASDVFVLPTLTEALPTVLAEAMAARLPVIASRVGGVPEMIVDGQNGILVQPEVVDSLINACTRLLRSPETRRALSAQGWLIVNQKFSIEQQVEQLKQLYLDQLQAYGKS
jgi:glycosyltransferase involved in cell wall biosynthesis